MRRLLAILLLLVVPLQISYAAVTGALGHESARCETKHFGHHPHDHDAGIVAHENQSDRGGGTFHDDCGFCHFNCLKFTTAPAPAIPAKPHDVYLLTEPLASPAVVLDGLDRPPHPRHA